MKEIEQIYFNDFGVAFYWRKNEQIITDRVQIVFKETGFYFSVDEIKDFVCIVNDMANKPCCNECKNKCRKFLLKTPLREIDLAVSYNELSDIKDLLEGTLFNINLYDYISNVCRN